MSADAVRPRRTTPSAADEIAVFARLFEDRRAAETDGGERPSTNATVLGHALGVPLVVAPVAFQGKMHPDGERGLARAAQFSWERSVRSIHAGYLKALGRTVPEAAEATS